MTITLKQVPLGSTVELGGDTEKRRLYVGEIDKGFAMLWKSEADFKSGKPWQVMTSLSSRIKNVRNAIGN